MHDAHIKRFLSVGWPSKKKGARPWSWIHFRSATRGSSDFVFNWSGLGLNQPMPVYIRPLHCYMRRWRDAYSHAPWPWRRHPAAILVTGFGKIIYYIYFNNIFHFCQQTPLQCTELFLLDGEKRRLTLMLRCHETGRSNHKGALQIQGPPMRSSRFWDKVLVHSFWTTSSVANTHTHTQSETLLNISKGYIVNQK